MKTIQNITIYRCDFCKKELKRKHAMVNHENRCSRNPVNFRPCLNCPKLERKEIEYDSGTASYVDGSPIYKKGNAFYCNAKKILLLHPKTKFFTGPGDINNVLLDNEETEQFEMPMKCDVYDEINKIWQC